MKTIGEATEALASYLEKHWHTTVSGMPGAWPHTITLVGKIPKAELEANFDRVRRWSLEWQEWERSQPGDLRRINRDVKQTYQSIPTHLTVSSAADAAQIVGGHWPQRLVRGRQRHQLLSESFPDLEITRIVRAIRTFSDVDVALLIAAASWFLSHDATGMTPRQVPIEGLHSKWLNNNRHLVAYLAGKPDLGLTTSRPARVHFGYLDPGWRGRRFDICTIGDPQAQPEYLPSTIVICENRDTAQLFPPLAGGIAVEGDGLAAVGTLARLSWITDCPHIVYWGDIDAAGYEILHGLRVSGLNAHSVLMDEPAYLRYERFGTNTDQHGKPLKCKPRKSLPDLREHERIVYNLLTDPTWRGFRRIEQERMPFIAALTAIDELLYSPAAVQDEVRHSSELGFCSED